MLAILIFTVASESAFTISIRILDVFRSSLTPKLVEALIYTQDYIRLALKLFLIEETIKELENLKRVIF